MWRKRPDPFPFGTWSGHESRLRTVVVTSNCIDNKLLNEPCLEMLCLAGMAFVCGCDPFIIPKMCFYLEEKIRYLHYTDSSNLVRNEHEHEEDLSLEVTS